MGLLVGLSELSTLCACGLSDELVGNFVKMNGGVELTSSKRTRFD